MCSCWEKSSETFFISFFFLIKKIWVYSGFNGDIIRYIILQNRDYSYEKLSFMIHSKTGIFLQISLQMYPYWSFKHLSTTMFCSCTYDNALKISRWLSVCLCENVCILSVWSAFIRVLHNLCFCYLKLTDAIQYLV